MWPAKFIGTDNWSRNTARWATQKRLKYQGRTTICKMLFGFYNEVRSTRDVFGLFVPEPVLDKIAKEGLNSIKLGGAEEGIATILFTDIRSFTAIAEQLLSAEFMNKDHDRDASLPAGLLTTKLHIPSARTDLVRLTERLNESL